MVTLMVLFRLYDTDTNAVASHDSNINASVSCDANGDGNGVT